MLRFLYLALITCWFGFAVAACAPDYSTNGVSTGNPSDLSGY